MRAPILIVLAGVVAGCGAPMQSPDAGPKCTAPTGSGTPHSGDIAQDETWTAAGSPHLLSSDVRVFSTVTIEPCAEVRLGERVRVTVGSSTQAGKIVAQGDATRAVQFVAQDATKPWAALSVDVKGSLDFTNTTLADGANPASAQNGGGAVLVYGVGSNQPVITRSLRFVDVTISKARGHAVNLQRMSGFTDDSRGLTVTESGSTAAPYPILVEAGAVGTLPTLSFSNNQASEILVEPRGSMPSDTFHARGYPYRLNGHLLVAPSTDGSMSTLTIEPGVTIKMDTTSDSGLTLGTSPQRRGLLIAEGTAALPITFTSPKPGPAPADWKNLYFRNTPNTGNKLTWAIVEYAGAFSGLQGYGCGPASNDASVIVASDTGRPSSAFIQNTIIRKGGGDTGLLLGWLSDLDGPDFVSTNTFTDVPACKVSRWRNATGNACPGSTAGSPVCVL